MALRHWRFFDKLGFLAARWFEGLGWHVCVRRDVVFGNARPLTPDDPIVPTFYIPFLNPDLPASAQGPAGRAHGRIVFAHSELQGTMSMAYGILEAHRAARQVMTML